MAKQVFNRFVNLFNLLGPGLLYAGAAVGVSHLVQSTRAGAAYGWVPAVAIVFIHFAKYPFFKAGPQYAMATGHSLVQGYAKLGRWALILFVLFTLGTMFAIAAAIVAVTSGLAAYIFDLSVAPQYISGCILLLTTLLLAAGQYKWLERIMRVMILVLSMATAAAFILSIFGEKPMVPEEETMVYDAAFLVLMIKLMGWMPAPLDLSVWHSIWVLEKRKAKGAFFSATVNSLDFNLGYWGTMLLGLLFLGMGRYFFFNSGINLPSSGLGFSKALLEMYAVKLGPWAFTVIAAAAFATMLSTTFSVLDAIPRSLEDAYRLVRPGANQRQVYIGALMLLALGSLTLLTAWEPGMMAMVDLATMLSFCAAPVYAWLNLRLMRSSHLPVHLRWSQPMTIYAWLSIAALLMLTIGFILLAW
jgi:Mn2+/Fe2+ NRAMP family transporter